MLIKIKQLWRKCIETLSVSCMAMMVGGFGQYVVGTDMNDILSDAGHKRDFVYAEKGNDVIVYTPSFNQSKEDYYDGGAGIDTLWIRMTRSEFYDPRFQADLLAFYYHLMTHTNIQSGSDHGQSYSFTSFKLRVRNMENIVVEKMNTRDKGPTINPPKKYLHLRDSSIDTIA